jgi:hypothetical protein
MLNWRINPASFSVRHAVPFAFVLFLLVGGALAFVHPFLFWAYAGLLGLYGLLALGATLQQVVQRRSAAAILCLPIFPLLHICYGLGTLWGVFRFGLRRLARLPVEHLQPWREDGGA